MRRKYKKPVLSVVVPTYNRLDYLKICLNSILTQNFKDYELIVIDDGSSDGTREYLENLSDPRIIRIHQENRGEYAATNLGLRAAEGDFITWVHSDDLLPKESIKKRVAVLKKNPEIDFCHGDINFIDPQGEITSLLPAVDWTARHTFNQYYTPLSKREKHYMVHHTTMMFRRSLIDKTGYFDDSLPCAGDLDWMLRALKYGSMVKVPGVLYHYRCHDDQISVEYAKLPNRNRVEKMIFKRYADGPLEKGRMI